MTASLLSETVASSLEQTTVEGGLDEGDRKPPFHARGRGQPDGNSACLRKIARRRGPTAIPCSTCSQWMKVTGRGRRTQSASCSPRLRCGPEGFSSRNNGPRWSGPRNENIRATRNEKPKRRAWRDGRLRNAGWRGSFLGEKPSSIVDSAIRTSWRWTVAHHFYPHSTNSDVSLRKNDNKDFNRVAGKFGVG